MRLLDYCLPARRRHSLWRRTTIALATAGVIGLLVFIGLFTPPVAAAPLLKIVSPTKGQTILGTEATVSFVVGNAAFGSETHLHLWLDTPEPRQDRATEITSHFDHVLTDLPPGPHVLTLEAVQPDHASFTPRILETVQFRIQPPISQRADSTPSAHGIPSEPVNPRLWQITGSGIGIAIIIGGILLWRKSTDP